MNKNDKKVLSFVICTGIIILVQLYTQSEMPKEANAGKLKPTKELSEVNLKLEIQAQVSANKEKVSNSSNLKVKIYT